MTKSIVFQLCLLTVTSVITVKSWDFGSIFTDISSGITDTFDDITDTISDISGTVTDTVSDTYNEIAEKIDSIMVPTLRENYNSWLDDEIELRGLWTNSAIVDWMEKASTGNQIVDDWIEKLTGNEKLESTELTAIQLQKYQQNMQCLYSAFRSILHLCI